MRTKAVPSFAYVAAVSPKTWVMYRGIARVTPADAERHLPQRGAVAALAGDHESPGPGIRIGKHPLDPERRGVREQVDRWPGEQAVSRGHSRDPQRRLIRPGIGGRLGQELGPGVTSIWPPGDTSITP